MKREYVTNQNNVIVGIKITPRKGRKEKEPFVIPIVDVRNGKQSRERANKILKGNPAGSKFIKESFSVMGHSYNMPSPRGNKL